MGDNRVCDACSRATPADLVYCIHCGAPGRPPPLTPARALHWPILAAMLTIIAIFFVLGLLTDRPGSGRGIVATVIAGIGGGPTNTPTPTPTPIPSDTPTATLIVIPTATPTVTTAALGPPAKTPTPVPTATLSPPPPAPGDDLLFVRLVADSDRDGNVDWEANRIICRVSSGGSDEHCLTHDSYSSSSPNWSPDRRSIVFTSDKDGDTELYLMDADGGNLRRLTFHPGTDHGPSWSPDGQWIVFHRELAGIGVELFRIRPDGSDEIQITRNGRVNRYPDWSVAGRIAYESGPYVAGEIPDLLDIYLTDPNGASEQRLTDNNYSVAPAWSPDGRFLAYGTGNGGRAHLAVYDSLTGQMDDATSDSDDNDAEPSWSPDGRHLVYARWEPWSPQLWVLDVTSRATWQLVSSSGYTDTQPAWAP